MVAKCPAVNTVAIEQEKFWDGDWTPHKVGWLIAGATAAVTCLLSLITILGHARNYTKPSQQRQIIRVLLFPPVYAVVSFFSYRYFRAYTYYELAEAAYEAFAIAAFLMLMLQYIGQSVQEQAHVFVKKDKKKMPLPFCCWRYRPSKAYFLVLLKWSVVQYCIVRPALSIAGIITEKYEVYCSSSLSYKYAYVYITSIDFVSISIALYGLIVLYTLVKDDLRGRKPLAKFATIKLGIFLIFYQGFVFSMLANHGVLHATEYWTTDNIADGLNALCTTCEMVLIAAMQMWAFNWREYHLDRISDEADGKMNAKGKTNVFMSLLHALNFFDVFVELWYEIVFVFDRMRGKSYTRHDARLDFVQAFGAEHDGDNDDDVESMPKKPGQMQYSPSSDRPMDMSERNDGQSVGYANGQWDGGHGQQQGSARSDQALLQQHYQDQSAYATQDHYDASRHYNYPTSGSPPQNLAPGTGGNHHDHQQYQHPRPQSWEPQAL